MADFVIADVKYNDGAAKALSGAGDGIVNSISGVIGTVSSAISGDNVAVTTNANLVTPLAKDIHALSLGVKTPSNKNMPLGVAVLDEVTSNSVLETFYAPIYVLTGVFGAIFVIGPFLVRKGEYQGIIRTSIMLTSFCMWIFWVTVYIAQMNPLVGPCLSNTTLAWIAYSWGNLAKELPPGFDDYNQE